MTKVIIERLDHLVLTVKSIEATCAFYSRALGMQIVTFGESGAQRAALVFDEQKINLHEQGHEFEPKADHPMPGSADLCFVASTPLADVIEYLHTEGVEIIAGPVPRTGALGPMTSIYLRDPDLNLIEIANYRKTGP